jgi:hypothetical protein
MDDEAKLAHKRELARLRAKKYYDAKQELINERRRNNYNTINGNKKDNEKMVIKKIEPIEPIETIETIETIEPINKVDKKPKKKKEKLIIIDDTAVKINEEDAINLKTNLSENTTKDYLKKLRKIHTILGKSILKTSNETIIKILTEAFENVSSRYSYLNVPIIVKLHYGYDADSLIEYRDKLRTERDGHTEAKKNDNSIIYYDLKCIHRDIERISQSNDYIKYVINYLLFNYGVRNKDLNVFITNDKSKLNSELNFLLIGDKSVKWIINDYKTKMTYGTKEIIIKNSNFIRVVKLIPNNTFLLSYEGIHISQSSLSNFIKSRTLHNLNEGEIFKLILHDSRNSKSLEKIKHQLSKWRGTDISTINQYYDGYGYND